MEQIWRNWHGAICASLLPSAFAASEITVEELGASQRKSIGERLVRLLMVLCMARLLQEFRPMLPMRPHRKGVHRHFIFTRQSLS